MKRRSFFQLVAATSLVPAAAQNKGATAPAAQPVAIETTNADAVAAPESTFFTRAQFACFHRLCEIILPPSGPNPGAVQAGAPAFLDFLIGASPADVQQLYREGLDVLDRRASEHFGHPFAQLPQENTDSLLQSLRDPWTYDPPVDPVARFLRRARQDIHTATMNSREYVAQASKRRRSASGIGQYWYPLD